MSFVTRLLNVFRKHSLDREFDEELSFHLDKRIERNVQCGMDRVAAEAEARRALGDIANLKRAMQEVRVMRTSVAVALLAALGVCVVVGTWLLTRSGRSAPVVYQISEQGVTPPAVLQERKPDYPEAAKQAKIQGTILMQCVVQTNGVCDDVRVTQSLDPTWLDQEAIEAIRDWRFRPGMLMGRPVPVRVNVEFSFTLRR
jgi:TonB family protein